MGRSGLGWVLAAGLLMGGFGLEAVAQSVPDDTLGGERSQVIDRGGTNFDIDGGARRGANLFHSFQEFNITEGGSIYFLNPLGIENILSRVTGSNPSNILGTLGVRGTANLFFVNPNGILFGSNSRLDVGGSFAATTADAIEFGEQGFFSATNPEAPSPLLAVNPSAFFFNQLPKGDITSRSTTPNPPNNLLGLRVPNGESLLLLGGNLSLDGGNIGDQRSGLHAPGGRVEIGAVASVGRVGLNPDGSLTLPDGLARGNVTLQNQAIVNVRLDDRGTIAIRSNNIRITGESDLAAGILRRQGTATSQAGDITLDATSLIQIRDSSRVANELEVNAVGNTEQGGNIYVLTAVLEVLDGSQLRTNTNGRGNAGNVVITATDRIRFQGRTNSLPSAALSIVGGRGIGQGGTIAIRTSILEVLDGARLNAVTRGQGNTGNIIIQASDRVHFQGRIGTFSSGASSRVDQNGNGQGGTIRVNTPILLMLDGAQLSASTSGQGNAGNVVVEATDRVRFQGVNVDGQISSGALTTVESTGRGQGGTIRVNTPILLMLDGAQLSASTSGQGNAGNVIIQASDRVRFQGQSTNEQAPSSAFSTVQRTSMGRGGNIRITAPILEVLDDAQLQTSTRGRGDAGNITIRASDRVRFQASSAAQSAVGRTGMGQGGTIRVVTPILEVFDGAQLQASTRGQGNAGSVIVRASDRVILDGVASDAFSSGLLTLTQEGSRGQGGTINVAAPMIYLANGAIINAGTSNSQRGGNVVIRANQFEAINGGQVITTTSSDGRAGDITLNADRIVLSGRDATYRERLQQLGREFVTNQGASSGLFANTGSNSTGNGGRITVNSTNLTLQDGARISAQSRGTGTAGDIRLNTSEQLQLTNSDITTTAARSSGGDITVNADTPSGLVILRGDSDITTNSLGNGGNITLRGSGIIAFDDSDILARSQDARGGNITLAPFFSNNPALESESPFDGNDRVDVNADGELASGIITTPDTTSIQNSLTELPDTAIDTDTLVANSCVVQSENGSNTFNITGTGGLPLRPGDRPLLPYRTRPVRSIPAETSDRTWQPGDAIVEPQGVYQLEDGRMVLSRECN